MYAMAMTPVVADIEAKLAKAQAKVERCEKALESARLEASDLETTLRVLRTLFDEPPTGQKANQPTTAVSERHRDIIECLYEGKANSQSPVQLFEAYKLVGDSGVTLDTLRTTVWRMADPEKQTAFAVGDNVYRVFREDGRYWKQKQLSPPSASEGSTEFGRVAELEEPGSSEQHPFRNGENVGSSPTPPSTVQTGGGFADDLDDDIPF